MNPMTTQQAAEYLGISEYYLRNMRHCLHQHLGPECFKGSHPRGEAWYYTKEACDAWAAHHQWRKTRTG